MEDISEFLPIKLSPGFITVAFHLGCIGCNFCSVRYQNSRGLIFSANVQRKYPITPVRMLKHLESLPAYRAKVPIRIGNDTDYRFEVDEASELILRLPENYPTAVLTRFPINMSDREVFDRDNVILKITATARSKYLKCPDNAQRVIESIGIARCPVSVTLGPITADNIEGTAMLIEEIPKIPNVSIYLKELNDEFDDSLRLIPMASQPQLLQLRNLVKKLGFRHVSQLMCPVNNLLGIPHKRAMDVPVDERFHCNDCSSSYLCHADNELRTDILHRTLDELGLLQTGPVERNGYKSYFIPVDKPTGLGDEAYVSEILTMKIKLSRTSEGTGNYSYSASKFVLERWQKVGFFPYHALLHESTDFLTSAFNDADKLLGRRK